MTGGNEAHEWSTWLSEAAALQPGAEDFIEANPSIHAGCVEAGGRDRARP